MTDKEIWCLY